MSSRRIQFFDGFTSETIPNSVIATGPSGDITWEGAWVSGDYTQNQAVEYNGSSYVCHTNTTSSQIPTDTNYWDLLAQKGDPFNLVEKSTTYTAVADDLIMCDTSGGAFTITLPASPTAGTRVIIKDATGDFDAFALSVATSDASTIENAASPYSLDEEYTWAEFIYVATTTNWVRLDPYTVKTDDSTLERSGSTIQIKDLGVTTGKLGNSSVTTAKITDANVTEAKLAGSSVTTDKLANDAVTTDKIANDNVTTAKLNAGAVTTAKITDANVTEAKLATDSVTTAKIAASNVTGAKLEDNIELPGTEGFVPPKGTTAQRPGTPVTGETRYNTDTAALENYNGTAWQEVGSGGVGGKNYILNPDATNDATSDIANTATTGSWTIAKTTTAAELPEESKGTAFKISGSGLTVNDTVEWAIEATGIDDADGGHMGHWEVKVKDISTTVSGEYKFQVYNVTDATYVGESSEVTSTGTYKGSVPLNGAADYELHLIALVAAPTDIGISGVTISAESVLIGTLSSDWEDVTDSITYSAGFGSTSRKKVVRRIDGPDYIYKGYFNAGTVTGTGGTHIDLGIEIAVDKLVNNANSSNIRNLDGWAQRQSGTSNFNTWDHMLAVDTNVSTTGFFLRLDSSSSVSFGSAPSVSGIVGNGDGIMWQVRVPAVELGNGSVMFGTEAQAQNARVRYYMASNTAFTAGNPIPYDTEDTTTHQTLGDWTNSSGRITVPAAGTYRITVRNQWTVARVAGDQDLIYVNRNGGGDTLERRLSSTTEVLALGSEVYLTPADTFFVSSNVSKTINSANTLSYLEISRVPDKSSNATGFPFADQFPGEYGMVRLFSARYYRAAALTATPNTTIPWDSTSTVLDEVGISNSSGSITVSNAGLYRVSSHLSTGSTSFTGAYRVLVNGALKSYIDSTTTAAKQNFTGSVSLKLQAGDVITLEHSQAVTVNTGDLTAWVEITSI